MGGTLVSLVSLMQRQDLRVKTRRSGCILMTFNVKCLNHSADRLQEEIFSRDKRVTGACFILIWASVLQQRTMMCTWSIMRKNCSKHMNFKDCCQISFRRTAGFFWTWHLDQFLFLSLGISLFYDQTILLCLVKKCRGNSTLSISDDPFLKYCPPLKYCSLWHGRDECSFVFIGIMEGIVVK